jgi:hypothetical protein
MISRIELVKKVKLHQIDKLVNINSLSIEGRGISTTISKQIFKLSNLEYLNLSKNRLTHD